MAEKPTMYRIYSIVPRSRHDDLWLNIGVAFAHDDGQGFNIMLQALPVHGDGKIIMRAYDPSNEDAEPKAEPKKKTDRSC